MNIRNIVIITIICFCFGILSCATTATGPVKKNIIKDYDIKGPVADMIKGGKLAEARAELDKLLGANPDDVEALYLKGILTLKEKEKAAVSAIDVKNDSIFFPKEAYNRDPAVTSVLSDAVAREVSEYWRKATFIDKNRKDIHFALCGLFTDSQNDRELINQIKAIKAIFPGEKLGYTLAGYAKRLFDMGKHLPAVGVYYTIASLYPEEQGLYSDLAALSFMYGNLPEAIRYMGIVFRMGNPDYKTAYNYFLVNMIVGNYPNAIAGLKAIPDSTLWKYYEGLNMYYRNIPDWKATLEDYLAGADAGKEGNEIAVAKFLVSEENKNDYDSYLKSLKGDKWVCHLVLVRRAMGLFPNEYDPFFYYGKIMAYYKNYYEAYTALRKIQAKSAALDYPEQSSFSFYYGWALQNVKKYGEANAEWQKLMLDGDLYKRSAACYFYGQSLLGYGRKDDAVSVFKKVSPDAGDSKYALYCRDLVIANTPKPAATAQ